MEPQHITLVVEQLLFTMVLDHQVLILVLQITGEQVVMVVVEHQIIVYLVHIQVHHQI